MIINSGFCLAQDTASSKKTNINNPSEKLQKKVHSEDNVVYKYIISTDEFSVALENSLSITSEMLKISGVISFNIDKETHTIIANCKLDKDMQIYATIKAKLAEFNIKLKSYNKEIYEK